MALVFKHTNAFLKAWKIYGYAQNQFHYGGVPVLGVVNSAGFNFRPFQLLGCQ